MWLTLDSRDGENSTLTHVITRATVLLGETDVVTYVGSWMNQRHTALADRAIMFCHLGLSAS